MTITKDINNEDFIRYYVEENKTLLDMANIFNCSRSTIRSRAKKLGLSRDRRGTSSVIRFEDLSGTTVGFLKILERIPLKGETRYLCECCCGTQIKLKKHSLTSREIISCKKCDKKNNLIGTIFGKLKVISINEDKTLKCLCECGNYCSVTRTNIFSTMQQRCYCCKEYEEITKSFWKRLLASANDRNIEFSLSPEYIYNLFKSQNKKCALSNLSISINHNSTVTTASLDRIDSSKGYIEGNVQWLHKKINMMKNVHSEYEFLSICKNVARGPKTKKTVLITGPNSMIGRKLIDKFPSDKYDIIPLPKNECNLLDLNSINREMINIRPDIVIHLATKSGGISENLRIPFTIYSETSLMGLNLISASLKVNLEKFIFIVPSCALNPENEELYEEDLYRGRPHPSVECHGAAKRCVETAGRLAMKQYGLNFVTCIANNSFGPYDNFGEGGKVISGMIRKFYEAIKNKDETIEFWGTGNPLREFIYCDDIASALFQITESPINFSPINITSDYEISIKDLAYKIGSIMGYNGVIIFDTAKPDGQMRKKMNSDKMRKYLDFPITDFDAALKETIDWYISTLEKE